MEVQLLIIMSVVVVLLIGFMISALRILRDVFEGFGMTITDMRRYKMEDNIRIVNLNDEPKVKPGNIQEWYNPDE